MENLAKLVYNHICFVVTHCMWEVELLASQGVP